MERLSRRIVLGGGAALVTAGCMGAASAPAGLILRRESVLNEIPRNYTGFGVETSQLAEPDFFSPSNTGLIALHRRLSPSGVLRIGGNASEFCRTPLFANPFDTPGVNATAYTARTEDGRLRIAMFKKDSSRNLMIQIDGLKARATAWRLEGPSSDATTGITLAVAAIAPRTSQWHRRPQTIDIAAPVVVPRASALLLMT